MITKKQFEAYEDVRRSGITNMFDVKTVSALSGICRADVHEIMQTYDALCEKYPKVRRD